MRSAARQLERERVLVRPIVGHGFRRVKYMTYIILFVLIIGHGELPQVRAAAADDLLAAAARRTIAGAGGIGFYGTLYRNSRVLSATLVRVLG